MSDERQPPKAVVDTNLFVSGLISKQGRPAQLIVELQRNAFQLMISDELRSELVEVLQRARFARRWGVTAEDRTAFLVLIDRQAIKVHPSEPSPVEVRDPKDAIVLMAALEGEADFLVTGDQDLLVLNGHPQLGSLQIVTVRAFLEALAS